VIMGGIVTAQQLSEVAVRVNTLRGLIAGLVEVTRLLDKRYPDDKDMAALRVEFAGLLCEANKTKIELDVLCKPAPITRSEGPVMRPERRGLPVGYGMLAAHDDSVREGG
jgi:hypothetical protein